MQWGGQQLPPPLPQKEQQYEDVNGSGNGGLYQVKVMTDEQLEVLRKQIAVYSTICELLVKMHRAFTAHQDLPGVGMGIPYCDPSHKIPSRQRWTPTPGQLQILERIFDEVNGTPSKQRIKEIESELSQHGQISESNVYNWFQNRRARSKRRQLLAAPNNVESEMEADVESAKEKLSNLENSRSKDNHVSRAGDLCFHGSETIPEMHSLDPILSKADSIFCSGDDARPGRSLDHLPLYDSVLSDPSSSRLNEKLEMARNYAFYPQAEKYNMMGSDSL